MGGSKLPTDYQIKILTTAGNQKCLTVSVFVFVFVFVSVSVTVSVDPCVLSHVTCQTSHVKCLC